MEKREKEIRIEIAGLEARIKCLKRENRLTILLYRNYFGGKMKILEYLRCHFNVMIALYALTVVLFGSITTFAIYCLLSRTYWFVNYLWPAAFLACIPMILFFLLIAAMIVQDRIRKRRNKDKPPTHGL